MLATSFGIWHAQTASSGSLGQLPSERSTNAIKRLEEFLKGSADRTATPYYLGIPSHVAAPSSMPETIRGWCADAGFVGDELEALVNICTIKTVDGEGAREDDVHGERSVRSL